MKKEALKPIEICIGNIIESMGNVEVVTGIIQESEGSFKIGHTGWNKGLGVIPDGISYETFPIDLTEEWKRCLNIHLYDKIPEWIKYVHQVQNFFKWSLDVNLLEIMDWKLLPTLSINVDEK